MGKAKSQDLELLEGSWSIQSLEMDGQKMPAVMLAAARIVVKGSRFTTTGMGSEYAGTLELDSSTTPPQITMHFEAGPEQGNRNLGIYELSGDSWRLCLATRGPERPSTFATTPGSGFALETLVRETSASTVKSKVRPAKAAAASEPVPSGPVTDFEGEWPMVSGIMDGKPMDASSVKWVKRVSQGKLSTVVAGPQVILKVEFTFDSAPSPKTIDYVNLAGTHKGKSQQGIYEFEGDLLKLCVAPPGSPRPATFHSPRGSGLTYTTWKRP